MRLLALFLLLGCTVTLTVDASLYARPRTFRTVTEPPPLRAETERPDKPDPGAVWVSGHWVWEGSWVWVAGAWKKPRPGTVWEPPVCVAHQGEYRYYDGYFRPRDEEPPPEYREPGHIQVHVPDAEVAANIPERVLVVPGRPVPTETMRPERPGTEPGTDVGAVGRPTTDPSLDPVGTPGGVPAGDPGSTNRPALTCSLPIGRVPRSPGNFVVQGAGFGNDVVVMVGGSTATVRSATASEIQATASGSGTVKVRRGDDEAECGRLELF